MNSSISEYSEGKKWIIILIAGALFFIVASPFAYKFTESPLAKLGIVKPSIDLAKSPGYGNLLVHTIVFMLLVRLVMFIKI